MKLPKFTREIKVVHFSILKYCTLGTVSPPMEVHIYTAFQKTDIKMLYPLIQ